MKPKISKTKTTHSILQLFGVMITAINFLWVAVFIFAAAMTFGTEFFGFVLIGGIIAVNLSAILYYYTSTKN